MVAKRRPLDSDGTNAASSHVSLLRLPAMALRWAGRLVCIQGERALYCWFLQVQLERVL